MLQGDRLKEIRLRCDLTQQEFALKIGITREQLGLYERNARKISKATSIILISTLKEKDIPYSFREQYKIGQRFYKIIEILKEDKDVFPEIEFNVTPTFLNLMYLGIEAVTEHVFNTLIDKYNVNLLYLIKCESPIFNGGNQSRNHENSLVEELQKQKSEIEILKTRIGILEKFILEN